MSACEKVRDRIEEYRVDMLDALERRDVEDHMSDCPGCAGRLARIREIEVALLEEATEEDPAPGESLAGVREAKDRMGRRGRRKEVAIMVAAVGMFMAIVAWMVGQGTDGSQPAQARFEEKKIGTAPADGSIDGLWWSADGKVLAYRVVKQNGMRYMVVGDRKGEERPYIHSPVISSAGRVAYAGGELGKFGIDVDGKWYPAHPTLVWSPDGKTLAYIGLQDNKPVIVVGDRRGEVFDEVGEILWEPDGSGVVYTAKKMDDWFIVRGGRKGEVFDAVKHLTFSPDGKRLAYVAKEGKEFVVVGDKKEKEHQQVRPPVFSGDGGTVGYWAIDNNQLDLVVNGVMVLSTYFDGGVGTPVFSHDGKVWAYSTGRQHVVSREHEGTRLETRGELWESVSNLIVSPDGQVVAYIGTKGKRNRLVVNDKEGEKFSLIKNVALGPDGRTFAYTAGRYGKQFIVAGDKVGEEFDEVLSGPVWSADGKKVAFVVRIGQELWSKVLEVKR